MADVALRSKRRTFHVQKNQSPSASMLASANCFRPAFVSSLQLSQFSQ